MHLVKPLILGLATLTNIVASASLGPRTNIAARANSAGCGKAPTIKTGTQTITVGGTQRKFRIRVPLNYNNNNKPYKLMYGLHWNGGTMDQVADGGTDKWNYFGIEKLANETMIFVAPQGLNGGWANSGGQDTKLIDAINDYVDAGLCVDQGQRFSIGFSYGAGMSYSLACNRANKFRAVAIIAGGQLSGCEGGNDPIAYFGIHGIKDGTLPIATGRSLRDRFIKNNGCNSLAGAKEPASGSRTHITTAATGCKQGYPVRWAAHDGGHIQAAADKPAPREEDGKNSWVEGEVWAFWNLPELSTPK
ncbi:hypothetical protein BCR34DRAFT_616852 [Clohesyomyces aquaticus]|uniref:Feruloyl esterase C n=1 Tax=Clohesyomyces aquaticus TaxID=1231657 RepID=A0A1Y1Z9M9_9PLEO|nr:hypothetical protein BCR34DRAFT_616852 [Clohesyomyces aquaticus]